MLMSKDPLIPPIWSVVRIIEYRILCKSGHEKYKDCRNGDIASHNYMFYTKTSILYKIV